ncbi:hypothetical protein [Marinobacter bohaiensis]|uniref:hypothetical protein n=1 Tax=Marinobacter bohaiensis TaxID=2201898 RepID=UPI0013A6BF73|nr:hypothetical protein [Marinobacter bohaiensis]
MTRTFVGCLLLVPTLALAGEQGGVLDTNYEVGAGYTKDRDSDSVDLSGTINLPLFGYVGSSAFVGGQTSQADSGSNQLDADNLGFGGSIYLRDFDLGKVGVSAAYTKTFFDSSSPAVPDDLKSYQYSAFGEYYIDRFTLGFQRTLVDVEDPVDDAHSWTGSVAWYPEDNTKLLLSGSGMDSRDNYSVALSHQPDALGESTEVSLGYTSSPHDDTFNLSLSYYFGTQVPLIDRDRKYR